MSSFDITNYYEPLVVAAIKRYAATVSLQDQDLLEDAACIALNQLPARYIRHHVDASFFLSPAERSDMQSAVDHAVHKAFDILKNTTELRL